MGWGGGAGGGPKRFYEIHVKAYTPYSDKSVWLPFKFSVEKSYKEDKCFLYFSLSFPPWFKGRWAIYVGEQVWD